MPGLDNRLTDGGEVFSLSRRPRSTPQKHYWRRSFDYFQGCINVRACPLSRHMHSSDYLQHMFAVLVNFSLSLSLSQAVPLPVTPVSVTANTSQQATRHDIWRVCRNTRRHFHVPSCESSTKQPRPLFSWFATSVSLSHTFSSKNWHLVFKQQKQSMCSYLGRGVKV
jgi:hypothetical protein